MLKELLLSYTFLMPKFVVPPPPPPEPLMVMEYHGDFKYKSRDCIKLEVKKRFPNAYIFLAHGEKSKDDDWYVLDGNEYIKDTAQNIVDDLRRKNPDVPIVFWVCNDHHKTLRGKNVWYAKTRVWAVPDDYVQYPLHPQRFEVERDKGSVGSIFEFVEGE